jgi:hypothetical protein
MDEEQIYQAICGALLVISIIAIISYLVLK